MKKLYIFVILFLMISSATFSQVGINPTGSLPDASAMLDVSSTDKGLLIPCMTTAQRNAITSPAEGLMVYDTQLGSLCFYRSGIWNQALGTSSGWMLKGNSGTNVSTDFVGTTDNVGLAFRFFNIPSGLINVNSTFFGYTAGKDNIGNYSTLIGSGAGWKVTSGHANTALGYQSLRNTTTGEANTALGIYALYLNSTGNDNVASGSSALYSNTSGGNNTGAGPSALYSTTTGSYNTAIGSSALYANTTGWNNTAVGSQAGVSANNLTNVTAIGYAALATASNQVRLGNDNITTFFCKGAYAATSSATPNMTVDEYGQIMRSTAPLLNGTGSANQVAFWSSPGILSGNNNLYWDNSNSRLGIGTASPNQQLELTGSLRFPFTTSSTTGVIFKGGNRFIHDFTSPSTNGNNIFIGIDAGNFTMNGPNAWNASDNTGVGTQTLNAVTSGSSNSAFGSNALRYNTSGIGNTAVGNLALDANETGNYNTAIGFQADLITNGLSNSVSIGYNVKAEASNQVRLGNSSITSFYCMGAWVATSTAKPNMVVDNNGKIMQSTATLLDGTGSANQVTFWSSPGILSGNNNLYWDNSNLRLGIGTSSPNQQLELTGSFRLPAAATSTTGVIFKGADRFIHDFKAPGSTGLNTFVGINAGNFTMSGNGSQSSFNTGIGYQSLTDLTTGSSNTACGHFSLNDNTTGQYNTALGEQSLRYNISGGHNVATGYGSILYSQTGGYNTAVGEEAGRGTNGNSFSNNALLGYRSGYLLTTGSNNILLGYQAGDAVSSGSNNIVIGYNIDVPNPASNNQVVIGSQSLLYGDLATLRIGMGTAAPGQKLEIKDGNILLSNSNLASTIMFAEPFAGGTNYTAIKAQNQAANITYQLPPDDGNPGDILRSDGVGVLSWIAPNAGDITAVGSMTSGDVFADATASGDWLGLGAAAGRIAFTDAATDYISMMNANVGIGTLAPGQQLEITGNFELPVTSSTAGIIYRGSSRFLHSYGTNNVFLGELAGNLTLSGGVNNTGIGDSTLIAVAGGDYNVAIGTSALRALTEGDGHVVIGTRAGIALADPTSGGYSTIIGYQAGKYTTADRNTFVGCESGMNNTAGFYNVFLGHQSGYHNTTGNYSTAIGFRALYNQTGNITDNAMKNTAVGFEAMYTNNPTSSTNGRENVAVGYQSLRQNQTGYNNTSVGSGALYTNTTGSYNTAIGSFALNLNLTGQQNTAVGRHALSNCTSSYNTGIGDGALQFLESGYRNTAVGMYALDQLTSGSDNTALGYMANCDAANCSNSIAIGYSAFASASDQVRLGNSDITSLYCDGAYMGNVGSTNRALFADVNGKIGYYTSSARYKDNIINMEDVDWLYDLRPVNFIYKTDDLKKKQYGLVAEEVEKVNPEFVSYNPDGSVETVSYSQLISPMLKAIQEQQALIEELQKRIETLEKNQQKL